MAYSVIATRLAQADAREKIRWLTANRSHAVAERWFMRYESARDSLIENSDRCPPVEEAGELGQNVRQLLFRFGKSYHRLVFTVEGETVVIHRVRHAAQDRLTDGDL